MNKIELLNLDEGNENKPEYDSEWLHEIIEETQVDLSEEIESPDAIVSIGEHEFNGNMYPTNAMTAGEFSVISAPSKTKKTFLKSALASAFIGGNNNSYFDNFKGNRKEDSETIIDIDTEQSPFYAQRSFRNTIKMSGAMYDNYYPFQLRTLSAEDRVHFIESYLEEKSVTNNLRLMFIDGIADLVKDSNDLAMSNEIVEKIMTWTSKYNIHICVIIHNAHGLKKPTGHLGSATTKKAETVFFLEKDEGNPNYVNVECGYSRGIDFDNFQFEIVNGLPQKVDEFSENTTESQYESPF